MESEEQEKTEKATPKRREDARKKGQIAKSRELTSAAMILGIAAVVIWLSPFMGNRIHGFVTYLWRSLSSTALTQQDLYHLLLTQMQMLFIILTPMIVLFNVLAVLSIAGQGGVVWSATPITPDLSRINPIKGLKRFFSLQILMDFVKTLIKFFMVAYLLYVIFNQEYASIIGAVHLDIRQIPELLKSLVAQMALWTGVAMAFLGIADFAFEWWRHEKKLRMSRQGIKDETKQTEGSPQVRARIRSIQRDIARKRMMSEVPKADVVVTNPTSLAIALRYDQASMESPKVVAKGAGLIAKKIREIAQAHGLPLVENKPLAQTLYKTAEVGEFIPPKLYRAVAEVLAYVYRLRGRRS